MTQLWAALDRIREVADQARAEIVDGSEWRGVALQALIEISELAEGPHRAREPEQAA